MLGMKKSKAEATQRMTFKTLEMQSLAVFDILVQYGVFGTKEIHRLYPQQLGFMSVIRYHSVRRDQNLEQNYHESCVRLLINLTVNHKNQAVFRDIEAYAHPTENTDMDYNGLNRDLASAVAV